jgi:ATP-dependent protease HslVU (ClpYQ) peptidase subunit
MTTIVANRTSMAADKRVSGVPVFRTSKIFRVRGSLIGFAGNTEQALRFIEWRRTPEAKPTFVETADFMALELSADGRLTYWGAEMVGIPIEDDFYAIGSGASYALGAMAMRASPKHAIEVAARFDCSTGSDVQTLTLGK